MLLYDVVHSVNSIDGKIEADALPGELVMQLGIEPGTYAVVEVHATTSMEQWDDYPRVDSLYLSFRNLTITSSDPKVWKLVEDEAVERWMSFEMFNEA